MSHVATSQKKIGWTFLTNHAHVLICIALDPEIRMRDVAEKVGITERAIQRIVRELEIDGFLEKSKDGRNNHYLVHADRPLKHPIEAHHNVGELLSILT